jgi:peptide/nickel transport system ATP-binding protein
LHLLEVQNLHTYYITRRGVAKAVDGVSLAIDKGEVIGIAGESGCGKTTAMLSIMRLLPDSAEIRQGKIMYGDQDLLKKTEKEMRDIRWKKVAFVFQATMSAFNPLLRIGDQIVEAIEAHEDVGRHNALERVSGLFSAVGLDAARAKDYPHELSGGMKQRAMIAMALACGPELLIADEPVTALDVIIQGQIIGLLKELQRNRGLSVMIITHDLSVIAELCDKTAIMYAGKIFESGNTMSVFHEPAHPYTQALISAFPNIRNTNVSFGTPIAGYPPDLIQPPAGCRFHPRCRFAMDICGKVEPELLNYKDRLVACHLVN